MPNTETPVWRKADPTLELHAELALGSCHEQPVTDDPARVTDQFPVAWVANWSTLPPPTREASSLTDLWCVSGCVAGAHVCPDGPQEMPEDFNLAEAESDAVLIAHYAARMLAGDQFPPITLIDCSDTEDPASGWLVEDGYHRISAALLAQITHIPAVTFTAAL